MTKLTGIITSESKLEGNLGVRNEINVDIIGTGARGKKGEDGYTPIKGVDYFDGKDGVDGYTPIKGIDYFDGSDANVTNTNVINALGYIPLSEDSLPDNLETTTGSQAKADIAESNAKDYTDVGLAGKVDKVTGKGLSTNDYTTVEKNKLSDIATGANNYTHPTSHPASMIEEDIDRNFVTVRQKDNLYGHIHEQIKASKTWVISHSLDKYPSISVVDSSGNQVTGSPKYIDKNNVVVEFTSAFSGKAYLN